MARIRKRNPTQYQHPSPSLDGLDAWLMNARDRIHRQVNVRESRRASGKQTVVAIDHLFACDLDAHAGWRVRTRRTFLPRDHFSSEIRTKVKTAEHVRGRAIYCHDLLAQEVVAALSYHISESSRMPVFILTLGTRTNRRGDAFLRYATLAGVLVLKYHVHAVSEKIGRGGFVDMDLAPGTVQFDIARELGFRRAPKVKGLRLAGDHLRQEPGQIPRAGRR